LPKGGISVYNLYAQKESLAGKKVILTRKVVKFTPEMMNKNWVHLQDGSNFEGVNDITITTLQKVTINAVVSLNERLYLIKIWDQATNTIFL
jgi:hypothetical protein